MEVRGLRETGKHSQDYVESEPQILLLYYFLNNCPEPASVAPGLVFWGASEEPLLQPPPEGAPRCSGAVDSAESGDCRREKSSEPQQRQRSFLARGTTSPWVPERTFAKLFSARSCRSDDKGKQEAERRSRGDERSASFARVAELGRAAAAGRPLPLSAEEGTGVGVRAAETRQRPATAVTALSAASETATVAGWRVPGLQGAAAQRSAQ